MSTGDKQKETCPDCHYPADAGHGPDCGETNVEVDSNGQTIVDIKAEVNETVLSRIQELDGKVISSFAQYQAIRARIPIEKIEILAELPEVISIRPAERPITN